MRLATYRRPGSDADRVGVVAEGRIHALAEGVRLLDLLGDDGERLAEAGRQALADPREVVDVSAARLRPPVPAPPSVRDFYAFEQPVRTARQRRGLEMDPDWYRLPVFYFSNPRALVGDSDAVPVPPGCVELDYELEVAAVVGRGGADLDPEEAEAAIAGYCVMNDWSARDLQRREMRLGLGPAKGKDFATGLGPVLVTPDELAGHRAGRAYEARAQVRR